MHLKATSVIRIADDSERTKARTAARHGVIALAIALSLPACTVGVQEESATGSVENDVIAGDVIGEEGSGYALVSSGCSSTLLSNEWALTAKHCFAAVHIAS